jgi:hypothetical protein
MSKEDYASFLFSVLTCMSFFTTDNASILWNVSYNKNARDDYGRVCFSDKNPFQVKETIVWDKGLGMNISGNHIISIGEGGTNNTRGNNTVAFGATALGGGAGGSYDSINIYESAISGGSGGGMYAFSVNEPPNINTISISGANSDNTFKYNDSITIYGNKGYPANIFNSSKRSGGGGGAGGYGDGYNGLYTNFGQSGIINNIIGTDYYFGAGGGGWGGDGGIGGAGSGGSTQNDNTSFIEIFNAGLINNYGAINNGTRGSVYLSSGICNGGNGGKNTGSGGGGAGYADSNKEAFGGTGGSGVVIIRWRKNFNLLKTLYDVQPKLSRKYNYNINKLSILDSGEYENKTLYNKSKLYIYEEKGTIPEYNKGSIVLNHGDRGGTSSIVFNNAGPTSSTFPETNNFGYISYRDNSNINDKSADKTSRFVIGTNSENNDHILLMPSGNVGIGTNNPSSKLDVN